MHRSDRVLNQSEDVVEDPLEELEDEDLETDDDIDDEDVDDEVMRSAR